jgi:RNA polymerase sigma-70 factor (ECF subfamily)
VANFKALLKEQLPSLIRYATALTRDADEALDLAEDTVLEALDHDDPPLSEQELRVWLLTILHDHRANPFRQADPLAPLTRPNTLGLTDLDRALGELPEQQRAVVLLIGLEGMSNGHCAAILRISTKTARSALAHAKINLCSMLGVRENLPRAA